MDVNEKAELLRFSFLEKYLNEMKEKIFVVCIIGKQSSGKSYLLNRIFGTRYSVAACRCTDGIWASFAKVEDQNFLILDCEGLFSSARSQKEEVQLLALLTALSDVTLLNQDLTFSRYLNDLLENLSAASDQLVGDTLFKGILTIVLRDISSSDNSGVNEELISNLNKQKSGDNQEVVFIRKLFNSMFNVEQLVNFENKCFDDQIVNFRKRFLEESKEASRWLNGEQLLSQLKILLCQLEMSDKTNSSLLQQQLQINRIFKIQKQEWLQLMLSLSNQDENKLQQDKTILDQNDTTRVKIFQDPTRRNVLSQSIQFKFTSEMKFSNQSKDHNTNITKINEMVQKQTEQKKIELLELIDFEFFKFNKQLEILDFFNSKRLQFQNHMQKQIVSLTFCMEKCNFCFLKCTKFQIHDTESKLQLELTSIKIQEIQNNQKELCTISDEELIELNYEFEQNQKKQIQLQKTLHFYESFKHCQSLQNTYQTIQAETETFFPLKNIKECFSAIQMLLENEQEAFQENQEPQIQAQNFENLKQGKQRLIQKAVQLQNSIKSIKDQLNEKKQNVLYLQGLQNEVKQKIIDINKQINNQEKSIEILTIDISEQLKQSSDQQQMSFYEKINKRYFQGEEIDRRMLQIEIKKNQGTQKQTQNLLEALEKDQQDWKEAISIFQKEGLTADEFFQLYQNQNEVFAQNNQKIQELNNELETIKKNTRVKQSQDRFNKSGNQMIQAQNIQQEIKKLEQEQQTEMNIEIEYISELIKTNQNQQILEQEQQQQTEMNIEIEQISELIKTNQNQQILEQEQQKQTEMNIEIEKQSDLIKTNQNQEIIQNKEQIFYKYRVKKDEEQQEFAKQITQFQNRIKQLNEEEEDFKLYLQFLSLRNQINSNQLTLNNYYQNLEDHQKKMGQVENNQQQNEKQVNIISSQIAKLENESEKQSLMELQINSSISKVQTLIDQYPQFLQKLQDLSNLNEEIKKIQNELQQVDLSFQQVDQKIQETEKEIEIIKFSNQAIDSKIQTQVQFHNLQQQLNQLLNEKENIFKSKEEHSCQRLTHFCDEQCCVCEGQLCKLLAGHNGEHLCEKLDHKCGENCAVQNCAEKCSLKRSHVEEHLCQQIHQCDQNCQYCTKQCEIEITKKHEKHTCGEIKCNKQCCLCESYCKEHHEHSLQIDAQHLCSKQEHCCNSKCQKQGVCKIVYQQIEAEWISTLSNFKYINYLQIDAGKQNCIVPIQGGQLCHEEDHVCFQDTDLQFHVCGEKCPECQAFCTKIFGHDGQHSTHQHRNKEKQQFTLQEGIIDTIDIDETKTYQVGDSAQPETCSESCRRRGRSHFHLVICQGGDKCLEVQPEYSSNARHSKVKYQKFEDLIFDEVLCIEYWQLQNWMHPINQPRILEEIKKCHYYCGNCGEKDKQFCKEQAWHSQSANFNDHSFTCPIDHKEKPPGLSICFVIDSTGSMKKCLNDSVKAIEEIMVKAKKTTISIEFSVVSYKDHGDPIVVSHQNFSDDLTCINFLKNLEADGGGDDPEAMLDGLEQAMKLDWKEENVKLLYLIADAPPHGNNPSKRVYHNFKDSYPDGCPCGLTQTPIFKMMKKKDVEFKIIKLNSFLELTIAEFKKDYTNLKVLDIRDNQDHFIPTIVQDVCKKLMDNEITFKQQS